MHAVSTLVSPFSVGITHRTSVLIILDSPVRDANRSDDFPPVQFLNYSIDVGQRGFTANGIAGRASVP